MLNIKVLHTKLANQQCAESPQEDGKQVFLYNVFPYMLLNEMLICSGCKEQGYDADYCKCNVYALFIEDVYCCIIVSVVNVSIVAVMMFLAGIVNEIRLR